MAMIVAYGSVPKDGGTFTFYRNIKDQLSVHDIDIRCVTVGRQQAKLIEKDYIDSNCVLIASESYDLKQQAHQFTEWCEKSGIDIVIGVNSEPILSSFPHLPERIRCVSRCANAFDHGYRITMSGRDRLAAIVALTPRLRDDLIKDYGADPSLLHLIPNGIDPALFEKASAAQRGFNEQVRLGFLGRLEHKQKGVLHLPHIVKELNKLNVPFILRVAGKGKHGKQLQEEMAKVSRLGQIEYLGALPPKEIPDFLASTDVFVFTSHFEGCPNALLEAMMAGCVPVSWLIEGITDYIIEDRKTGYLIKNRDYAGFAAAISELSSGSQTLLEMSRKVAYEARKRFSNERAASQYAELFHNVMKQAPPSWKPVDWREFSGDQNFRHSWIERSLPFVYHGLKDALNGK